MSAKSIYDAIMAAIKFKESKLTDCQDLKIYLLDYPQSEIVEIGRIKDEYLFFTVNSPQYGQSTFLLPPTSHPLLFVVSDLTQISSGPKRHTVGFLGDVHMSD